MELTQDHCPMAGFETSGVELSDSVSVLVKHVL
jgi:hypothetical protein